jgi:Type I restriction enzyme R protein N terminus (HSDR_N)
MLTETKKAKLHDNLKAYHKRFLNGNITDLDESGTRIMINHFLTDVLGFVALEEVRTEYMIKGTYADYMIQLSGTRHFLVEVKAFSINLNESHLRQAVNYGANEGVEWALLTNGKQFDFYKILFEKPITHQLIFSINLSDATVVKNATEVIQFLAKDAVVKGGLDVLWNKSLALTPDSLAYTLLCEDVVALVRKNVNKKYETKFEDSQIQETILKIITEKVVMKDFKMPKLAGKKAPQVKKVQTIPENNNQESNN